MRPGEDDDMVVVVAMRKVSPDRWLASVTNDSSARGVDQRASASTTAKRNVDVDVMSQQNLSGTKDRKEMVVGP